VSLGSASLTSLLAGPDGPIEYLTTGSGSPSTVFAHGLAGSIDTTRPFGSGVPGSRTFLHFRGHGASAAPETPWTYAALAAELRAVADTVGAAQALGVSMGAGALCHWLEQEPVRFERLVFVIPAVLDRPREDAALDRLVAMADRADERDVDGMTELLLLEQPEPVRADRAVRTWCRGQATHLVGTPVSRALRTLPHAVAMDDREALRGVRAPALVLAQEDDPAHPVSVAEQLAGLLPDARLEVLPPGGLMWRHRATVRRLIGLFLTPSTAW
jgi:pimeloyl-ACP methyl ester carboxylesterase